MWTGRVVDFLRRIPHRRGKPFDGLQICAYFPRPPRPLRPNEICEFFPELKEGEKTIGRQILERFWAEDREGFC